MKAYNIFWFFIAAIAAAAPIPIIKKYTEDHDMKWIGASAVSYLILIYAYTVILDDKNITIVYPILKVLSVLIVIGVGVLAFSNKIDTQSIIGILLGIASIYILSGKIESKK
jgi:multidrug transporter EmrE-like cation transporter